MKKNGESVCWFKPRSYIHFDSPISFLKVKSIVFDRDRVASHSFYPLLNFTVKSYKIFKTKSGVEKKRKEREISYAAHIDSHIYSYYSACLGLEYEKILGKHDLNNNVLAFRSLGKSNIEFANRAFEDIKSKGECSVVALDVSGFFDNLDHRILKGLWCQLLGEKQLPKDHYNIFKSITKYAKVSKVEAYRAFNISPNNPSFSRRKICGPAEFREIVRSKGLIAVNPNQFGVPQGTPISAMLSNIYMLEFDIKIKEVVEEKGGVYYRYCDDMLFIVSKEFKNDIELFAQKEIDKLKLKINTDKTEIRNFWYEGATLTCDKPVQYLGFLFDGQRKLIRSSALARYSNRMKKGVRLAKLTMNKRNNIKRANGVAPRDLYKRKLYDRYSHLGSRNFITYGFRAATLMESKAIRKQLKPLWLRLKREMER